MTDALSVRTPRLQLVPLSIDELDLLIDGDLHGASERAGFLLSSNFMAVVNEQFLAHHRDMMKNAPDEQGWCLRAVLRSEDNVVIGNAGFHGPPSIAGRAEIGYTILEPYRSLGFGGETAQGLVSWAKSQGMDIVYAAVAPTNEASTRIVHSIGFSLSNDQPGGDELLYELRL